MNKIIAILCLTCSTAFAHDEMSNTDMAIESAFLAALAVDYSQTKTIPKFCDGRTNCTIHETNPLLGSNPSDARIRNYFVGVAITHAAITYALPKEYRKVWIGSGIGLELVVIGRNKRLGLSTKF